MTQTLEGPSVGEIIHQHQQSIRNSIQIDVFIEELLEDTNPSHSAVKDGHKYNMMTR